LDNTDNIDSVIQIILSSSPWRPACLAKTPQSSSETEKSGNLRGLDKFSIGKAAYFILGKTCGAPCEKKFIKFQKYHLSPLKIFSKIRLFNRGKPGGKRQFWVKNII
jgi:hypothetical protein